MNLIQNTENIRNILLNPIQAWKNIKFEKLDLKQFYLIHLSGIILLIFAGRLVGKSLEILAVSNFYHIFLYSLFSLICDFLSFYISVRIVNKLLPSYSVSENIKKVTLLVYYSLLPHYFFLFAVSLFPSMYFFGIISLYGLFIFWAGIKSIFEFKSEDYPIFFIISIIITIGIHILLRFIVILPFFSII